MLCVEHCFNILLCCDMLMPFSYMYDLYVTSIIVILSEQRDSPVASPPLRRLRISGSRPLQRRQ